MSELSLSLVVKMIDRVTAPLAKVNTGINKFTQPVRQTTGAFSNLGKEFDRFKKVTGITKVAESGQKMGKAFGEVGKEVAKLGAGLGIVGGAATWLFKTQLIDTAAEFERFGAILETVEGDSGKAKKALTWVSDFAAATPFELNEVMDSFVKLRSYGLDPTNGLLKTLGDTAAAMGKPMSQAVEAVADAVTGENERLKEFGIKAAVIGDKIVYEYTANGKTMRKAAARSSREQIQSTLESIWNEKYAGAMQKQSTTWGGMMSNLGDQWTRFKLMLAGAGVFDFLKGKLAGVLDKINAMAESGELQKLADLWGKKLAEGLEKAWDAGMKLIGALGTLYGVFTWVSEAVGGVENLMVIVAGIMAGKLLVAIYGATTAIYAMGAAILTTPVGWIALAIAALVGIIWGAVKVVMLLGKFFGWAAFQIYDNWDGIVEFFAGIGAQIKEIWTAVIDWVSEKFDFITEKIKGLRSYLPEWLGGTTSVDVKAQAPATAPLKMGAPVGNLVERGAATSRAEVGGVVRVEIDSKGRPHVKEASSDNKSVPLDVYTGYAMGY